MESEKSTSSRLRLTVQLIFSNAYIHIHTCTHTHTTSSITYNWVCTYHLKFIYLRFHIILIFQIKNKLLGDIWCSSYIFLSYNKLIIFFSSCLCLIKSLYFQLILRGKYKWIRFGVLTQWNKQTASFFICSLMCTYIYICTHIYIYIYYI